MRPKAFRIIWIFEYYGAVDILVDLQTATGLNFLELIGANSGRGQERGEHEF